ncbi:hypothetical protein LCGC14_0730250 [marine sediment metagenome]|uniref:Uncharacterized protein n=1 Tax=marine sediment metagenome TaxID=412755 RepID=A0A0F9Q9U8_9ZZZZ|nr:hypothetical protein [bacterium]
MKKNLTKKIFLIGFIALIIFSAFLTPTTKAQPVAYNGANTERFPYHSIYPSEIYEINSTLTIPSSVVIAPEEYGRYEFVHGNESTFIIDGTPTSRSGYVLWGDFFSINATTSSVIAQYLDFYFAFWNESAPIFESPSTVQATFIPVDTNGNVSPSIFNKVADFYNGSNRWVNGGRNYNNLSLHFWNATDIFVTANYTDNGILKIQKTNYSGNYVVSTSLMSEPARMAPQFSFTTEDAILNISSSNIKLDVNITDSDNNNDGVIDVDYLYRVKIGSTWSNWSAITSLIDVDLNSLSSGAHQITLEVKNMYGVTQEQIMIRYTAPPTENIPSYSTWVIALIVLVGTSFLIYRRKQKLR